MIQKLLCFRHEGDMCSASSRGMNILFAMQALLCLAYLITDNLAGQKRLIMSGLGWLQGTPALRQVLRVCIHSSFVQERGASRAVLRAFCHGNPEGQAMLAGTFAPGKAGGKGLKM